MMAYKGNNKDQREFGSYQRKHTLLSIFGIRECPFWILGRDDDGMYKGK